MIVQLFYEWKKPTSPKCLAKHATETHLVEIGNIVGLKMAAFVYFRNVTHICTVGFLKWFPMLVI